MSIGESKEFFVLRKNPSQRGFRPSDYNLGDDRMRRTPSSIDAVVRWCAVTPTLEPPRASVPGVTSPTLPDLLTVAALAVIAYALSDFIHEGLGHGGSCLLIGGRPLLLSTVEFQCGIHGTRIVAAAGTIANFVVGMLSWFTLHFVRRAARLRYFLWVLMVVNLMQAAGYFLFSGVADFGDWAVVIHALEPAWAWRLALVIFGVVSYVAVVLLGVSELRPFLGSIGSERLLRARRLTWTPYLFGCIFICIAGLFNPAGMFLVAASAAAASFGGTSGFTWMGVWFRGPHFPPSALQMPPLTRSWPWIISAAIIGIAFIAVLGPAVRF